MLPMPMSSVLLVQRASALFAPFFVAVEASIVRSPRPVIVFSLSPIPFSVIRDNLPCVNCLLVLILAL